ncbi:replication-relaxation family protein [Spirillospora sp. CA-255316]
MGRGLSGRTLTGSRATQRTLLDLASRLTPRDRQVIRAVADQRVLTTGQICDLAFSSEITARHRLAVLTGLGTLARFRPRLDRGSAPWHYVLDVHGAAVLDAEDDANDDAEDKTRNPANKARPELLARVRRDKSLAIASSPRLRHTVECNTFFTTLIRNSRTARATGVRTGELVEWWPAARTATWARGIRPDAVARWQEGGNAVDFFFEYDTGSENLKQLADKLYRYAEAWEYNFPYSFDDSRRLPWLIFAFTRQGREPSARRALDQATPSAGKYGGLFPFPIATGVLDEQSWADPAGPWWLPLNTWAHLCDGRAPSRSLLVAQPTGPRRLRLAQLPPAVRAKRDPDADTHHGTGEDTW